MLLTIIYEGTLTSSVENRILDSMLLKLNRYWRSACLATPFTGLNTSLLVCVVIEVGVGISGEIATLTVHGGLFRCHAEQSCKVTKSYIRFVKSSSGHSQCWRLHRRESRLNMEAIHNFYQWFWFETGSDICSADRYVNLHAEELTINLGIRVKRIPICIRYIGRDWARNSKVVVNFITVCREEGFGLHLVKGCDPIVALNPGLQKHRVKLCAMHQLDSCFMLDQGGGREPSPSWFRRQFLADTCASKIKGKTRTIMKRCFDKLFLHYRPQLM